MEFRTKDEIEGKIKNPSFWDRLQYIIYDQFSLKRDHNIIMDDMVFKMARNQFNNEMLDVKYLLNEIREN
jgi:hypothetical protein